MCVSTSHKCVYLASDGGRLCRPYIIVENERPLLRQAHIDKLNLGERTFEDFLKMGIIEYLDVNEESDAHITIYEKDIHRFGHFLKKVNYNLPNFYNSFSFLIFSF